MNTPDENGLEYERDELMSLARRLPTAIAPQRDLWPGIEKAISEDASRTRWNRIVAQAAAVVMLVGGSSGITWFAMKQDMQTPAPTFEVQPLVLEPVSGNFGSDYHLGTEFMAARSDLASRLDRELQSLPPETQAEVRRNMIRIRSAINEINLALAEEPDNALLQELLLSTYREELTVMRRVEGLASAAMRRNDF
jgi:hypothetical protein